MLLSQLPWFLCQKWIESKSLDQVLNSVLYSIGIFVYHYSNTTFSWLLWLYIVLQLSSLICFKWKLLSCVWLFVTPWTVYGILQARLLEWVVFPITRGSSQPRDRTQVSCIAARFFTSWATRELYSFSRLCLLF